MKIVGSNMVWNNSTLTNFDCSQEHPFVTKGCSCSHTLGISNASLKYDQHHFTEAPDIDRCPPALTNLGRYIFYHTNFDSFTRTFIHQSQIKWILFSSTFSTAHLLTYFSHISTGNRCPSVIDSRMAKVEEGSNKLTRNDLLRHEPTKMNIFHFC